MILNWMQQFPSQALDVGMGQTRLNAMYCNDSLAVVLGAGYLNQLISSGNQGAAPNPNQGYNPLPQDVWAINYAGGFGFFTVSINANGVVSLAQSNGQASVQVPLTAAQFNGMYAAPVLLVPAVAGKSILVHSMQLALTYGSAAFASGGVVAAQAGSTVHGGGTLVTNTEAAADFFATANTLFSFAGAGGGIIPVNTGIYLSNQTGAFTTGTGSSFVANVNYSLM